MNLDLILEYGVWGGLYRRLLGASWRATIIDAPTGQRYAGSDDSPWLAIGWALHERARRQAGGGPVMARHPDDLPWDRPIAVHRETPLTITISPYADTDIPPPPPAKTKKSKQHDR